MAFLNRLIWLFAILTILVFLTLKLPFLNIFEKQQPIEPDSRPILIQPVAWHLVDSSIVVAAQKSRKSAEDYAAKELDRWLRGLMFSVDHDFIEWYFGYWNQQRLALKGLFHAGLNKWDPALPNGRDRVTEEIQTEFMMRVLHPPIAQMELERITRGAVSLYVDSLRYYVDAIPEQYSIPRGAWNRYTQNIALITRNTEGNRQTELSLKALTASSVAGGVLLASSIRALGAKFATRVSTRLATKSSAGLATHSAHKVIGKSGRRFLGPVISIGIIFWEIYDHQKTREEFEPILRQSIYTYLQEMKDSLLHDTESGLTAIIHEIDTGIVDSLNKKKSTTVPPDSTTII